MINKLFFVLFLFTGIYAFGQQSDCKVKLPEISGTYSGGCKKGLAQGKGIAQGIDRYEGQFTRGLPEGRGVYTWADGTIYDGQWKDGMRDGKGKMIYRDSVVTGYWKANKYLGTEIIPPYKIIISRNVSRESITKTVETGNGVRIRIMLGGVDNSSVEDFSLAFSNGSEYRNVNVYGVQNCNVPYDVVVRYRSWNQLHTAQYDVLFEFTINEPGTWSVVLTNM
jgi:hypothetical protein